MIKKNQNPKTDQKKSNFKGKTGVKKNQKKTNFKGKTGVKKNQN